MLIHLHVKYGCFHYTMVVLSNGYQTIHSANPKIFAHMACYRKSLPTSEMDATDFTFFPVEENKVAGLLCYTMFYNYP